MWRATKLITAFWYSQGQHSGPATRFEYPPDSCLRSLTPPLPLSPAMRTEMVRDPCLHQHSARRVSSAYLQQLHAAWQCTMAAELSLGCKRQVTPPTASVMPTHAASWAGNRRLAYSRKNHLSLSP